MEFDLGPFLPLVQIVTLPIALAKLLFWAIGNFVVFDLLQLGPYLPIQL